MKVRKQTAIIITLISAIAVYILRRMELKYALDGVYMVIDKGEIHSVILRVASVASCLAIALVLFLSRDKTATAVNYDVAISPVVKILFIISGAMLLLGGALHLNWTQYYYYEVRWLQMLFVFSVLVLGAVIILCVFLPDTAGFHLMCIGALCAAMWMLYSYRYNANNPSMWYFIYETLSVLCLSLGCYYFAGYGFGCRKPRLAILFGCFAAVLASASLADKEQLKDILIYLAQLPLGIGLACAVSESTGKEDNDGATDAACVNIDPAQEINQ